MPQALTETLRDVGEVEIEKGEEDTYFDSEEFIHQLTHVLRFKSGDLLHVFNSEVGEYMVSITGFTKKAMNIKLEKEIEDMKSNTGVRITLAMSLIKKDKLELVAEKATELGIETLIPIVTERVIQKNVPNERLLRIAKEAAEQSGRISIPEIRDIEEFKDILKTVKNYDLCLFGNMEGELSYKDISNTFEKDSVKSLLLFIGPEGGWTEGEIELFKTNGVKSISIQKNTLRAETAAIGVLGFLSGLAR